MPRQPIQLTEPQACALADAMPAIIARHPPDNLNWRAFVDEFIRAVHAATGKTYSAPVYRRLLGEYAPGRAPSTDTLAAAKKDLERELAMQARATAQVADRAPGPELGEVVARALARVLASAPRDTPESDMLRAQLSYLHGQLEQAERDVLEVRGQAARLAGELLAANEIRTALQAQLETANAATASQASRIEQLAVEMSDIRTFAMNAIDGVRGETRAWQERCADAEARLKREQRHLETFRQLAYRAGAAVPPELDKG